MALVTIQLIEGLERGQVYAELPTPVTIGREDDNSVRLNDERVSRFHAKIQEDGGRIILTDLDSTNGTRVNGHPVQMRVLQVGDQLSIGRCMLVFGSRREIAEHARKLDHEHRTLAASEERTLKNSDSGRSSHRRDSLEGSGDESPVDVEEPLDELFPDGPPVPPVGMRPLHRAQVSDFLAYCHEQLRQVILAGTEDPNNKGQMEQMRLNWAAWQRMLQLEMDFAVYMRKIAEPDA
ncbi:MAG TPA: FHA domain-containing protein [Planctomycetaceae bacterium]|nr:FHA domain-containing protein [Planctomycetaceae bacterium]